MASTNKTSNLQLSQFIATDTPTWLVDYNGDMEKIDAGVGRVEELAETASTQAVGVASGLQATNQNVTTLSGQVANVQNQANTTTASVNGINQRLGNTDISGIGDGTITGAISAQNSNLNKYQFVTLVERINGEGTVHELSESIANFRYLIFELVSTDNTYNNIRQSAIIPVEHFRGNINNKVSFESYVSQRNYCHIQYTSDTRVTVASNNNTTIGVTILGIK